MHLGIEKKNGRHTLAKLRNIDKEKMIDASQEHPMPIELIKRVSVGLKKGSGQK